MRKCGRRSDTVNAFGANGFVVSVMSAAYDKSMSLELWLSDPCCAMHKPQRRRVSARWCNQTLMRFTTMLLDAMQRTPRRAASLSLAINGEACAVDVVD